jgi:hypothetical protein
MKIRRKNVLVVLVLALFSAAPQRDGATIVNSGSTNAAGYTISVWSDGTGSAMVRGATAATSFSISQEAAERFFQDVKAARSNGAQLQHCMKSASFGTRTVVQWHGWVSPDLQCPPFTDEVRALAGDVQTVEGSANIQPGSPLRRVPLPAEMRKIPTATPEVQPT